MPITIENEEWYTREEARAVIAKNSNKPLDEIPIRYLRDLATARKKNKLREERFAPALRSLKLSPHTLLLHKRDVDNYVMKPRGVKSSERKGQKQRVRPEQTAD